MDEVAGSLLDRNFQAVLPFPDRMNAVTVDHLRWKRIYFVGKNGALFYRKPTVIVGMEATFQKRP
jgi:hypothetical protein